MLHNMLNPEPTSTGIRSGNRVIGYSAAIRLLDNGRYDKHLADGMEILACIMEAVESNWITLNIEKELILWRWLLAAVFITEELEKNGTVDSGFFIMKTILSGKTHHVLRAYKHLLREAK